MIKRILSALICTAIVCCTVCASADTSDWIVYDIPDVDSVEGTVLDASYLLDAPAGKHGFLDHTSGDNFVFEDGTDMRFWGTCLSDSDAFMSKENARLLAKRFAQLGFNLVRFISVEGEVFSGKTADGKRDINRDNLDKLHYLISELKARGIYVMFDVNAGYPYASEDNIDDEENISRSFKVYGYFDSKMIDLQKRLVSEMMSALNPYTGMRLKDDPAVVCINLRNETSVATSTAVSRSSVYYNNKLQAMFNAYLKDKYQNDENLKNAWTHTYPYNASAAVVLDEDESLENGTVRIPDINKLRNDNLKSGKVYCKLRQIETMQFLVDMQSDYFALMTDFLRSDLGMKCRISGCTAYDVQAITLANYYSDINTDYIETHIYRGHVQGTKYILYEDAATGNKSVSSGFLEEPTSIMQKRDKNFGQADKLTDNGYYFLTHAMSSNISGKPHIVSEWNIGAGHPYRSEGLLLMAAYGAMHNNNFVMYDWGNSDMSSYSGMYMNEQFATFNQPNYVSALPAASAIFLRRDASEAGRGFSYERYVGDEPVSREFQREASTDYDKLDQFVENKVLSHRSALVGKTGISFDDESSYDDSDNSNDILYLTKKYADSGVYISDTGDMSFDTNNGIYKLNTPRAQCISGFVGGGNIELDDIIYSIDNDFATVYLTSVGSEDIYKSNSILLTAVGNQKNSGQQMSDDGKDFVDKKVGSSPILCEPIGGSVTLKTTDEITVYALDNSGNRKHEIAVTNVSGGKKFNLSADSLSYEIVRQNVSGVKNAHIELGDRSVQPIFGDVADSDRQYIERAYLLGLIEGKSDSLFAPNESITRGDFIYALMRALNIYVYSNSSAYSDVTSDDSRFKQLTIAEKLGFLKFYSGDELGIDSAVSYSDMVSIVGNAYLASDRGADAADKYSNSELENMLKKEGFLNGVSVGGNISRRDAARILYNLMWN